MDNLNTQKGKLAQEWLEGNPLVTFHYTPTHATWVNLAESFFSILTRPGLQQTKATPTMPSRFPIIGAIPAIAWSCGLTSALPRQIKKMTLDGDGRPID